MKRMIIGTVLLFMFIGSFIIGYAVLYEPINYISEAMGDAYPEDAESYDDVNSFMDGLPNIFIAAIATGIILALIWYAAWGHKKEYEQY